MRSALVTKFQYVAEHYFPERRIFINSQNGLLQISLRTQTQITACFSVVVLLTWMLLSSSLLFVERIELKNLRQQAVEDASFYQNSLQNLASDRDAKVAQIKEARQSFQRTLKFATQVHTQLLQAEIKRQELEASLAILQDKLASTNKLAGPVRLVPEVIMTAPQPNLNSVVVVESQTTIKRLLDVLDNINVERDLMMINTNKIIRESEELRLELQLTEEKNQRIFRKLEDALSISIQPLDKMFRAVGLDSETLLKNVRRGYSGLGGPDMPTDFTAPDTPADANMVRMQQLLDQMDELNLYRIAAENIPLAHPVTSTHRRTSGFGLRWGRPHKGVDFAAPKGTPIRSTANGTVTFAGWESGYGRLVKISHSNRIETRYAHLSKIRVKKGQRVSRGELIGDMGNSGRSTGTHLHYEVRQNGVAVNPMSYIKAAKNVF